MMTIHDTLHYCRSDLPMTYVRAYRRHVSAIGVFQCSLILAYAITPLKMCLDHRNLRRWFRYLLSALPPALMRLREREREREMANFTPSSCFFFVYFLRQFAAPALQMVRKYQFCKVCYYYNLIIKGLIKGHPTVELVTYYSSRNVYVNSSLYCMPIG